jgi:hypothetical protein
MHLKAVAYAVPIMMSVVVEAESIVEEGRKCHL